MSHECARSSTFSDLAFKQLCFRAAETNRRSTIRDKDAAYFEEGRPGIDRRTDETVQWSEASREVERSRDDYSVAVERIYGQKQIGEVQISTEIGKTEEEENRSEARKVTRYLGRKEIAHTIYSAVRKQKLDKKKNNLSCVSKQQRIFNIISERFSFLRLSLHTHTHTIMPLRDVSI